MKMELHTSIFMQSVKHVVHLGNSLRTISNVECSKDGSKNKNIYDTTILTGTARTSSEIRTRTRSIQHCFGCALHSPCHRRRYYVVPMLDNSTLRFCGHHGLSDLEVVQTMLHQAKVTVTTAGLSSSPVSTKNITIELSGFACASPA